MKLFQRSLLHCLWLSGVAAKGGGGDDAPSAGTEGASDTDLLQQEHYTLTVMVPATFPPYNDFSEDKGIHGFDINFTKAVCKAGGLTCPIITAPYDRAWTNSKFGYMGDGLRSREFDCAASSSNTKGRRSLVFSDPYTARENATVVKVSGNSLVDKDLTDKRVGAVKGSACGLDWSRSQLPLARMIVEFADGRTMFEELQKKTVDAAMVCDEAHLAALRNEFSSKSLSPVSVEVVKTITGISDGLAFMCHPSRTFQLLRLNQGIRSFRETADFTALCAAYPKVSCESQRTEGEAHEEEEDKSACNLLRPLAASAACVLASAAVAAFGFTG